MRRGELCGSVQPTPSVRSQERDRTHVPGHVQSLVTGRFQAFQKCPDGGLAPRF
jgi:hypothetical protein